MTMSGIVEATGSAGEWGADFVLAALLPIRNWGTAHPDVGNPVGIIIGY